MEDKEQTPQHSAFETFRKYHHRLVELMYPDFSSLEVTKELRRRWASTHSNIQKSYENAGTQETPTGLSILKRKPTQVSETGMASESCPCHDHNVSKSPSPPYPIKPKMPVKPKLPKSSFDFFVDTAFGSDSSDEYSK